MAPGGPSRLGRSSYVKKTFRITTAVLQLWSLLRQDLEGCFGRLELCFFRNDWSCFCIGIQGGSWIKIIETDGAGHDDFLKDGAPHCNVRRDFYDTERGIRPKPVQHVESPQESQSWWCGKLYLCFHVCLLNVVISLFRNTTSLGVHFLLTQYLASGVATGVYEHQTCLFYVQSSV